MVTPLLDRLAALGIRVEVNGDKLRLVHGARLPSALLDHVRQHKPEITKLLKAYDRPVLTMSDIPFPGGYQGLPQEPVALGLKVADALGQYDPVLRKFNVLSFVTSWLLDHFQYRATGAFDNVEVGKLFEAVKAEKVRLLRAYEAQKQA